MHRNNAWYWGANKKSRMYRYKIYAYDGLTILTRSITLCFPITLNCSLRNEGGWYIRASGHWCDSVTMTRCVLVKKMPCRFNADSSKTKNSWINLTLKPRDTIRHMKIIKSQTQNFAKLLQLPSLEANMGRVTTLHIDHYKRYKIVEFQHCEHYKIEV